MTRFSVGSSAPSAEDEFAYLVVGSDVVVGGGPVVGLLLVVAVFLVGKRGEEGVVVVVVVLDKLEEFLVVALSKMVNVVLKKASDP